MTSRKTKLERKERDRARRQELSRSLGALVPAEVQAYRMFPSHGDVALAFAPANKGLRRRLAKAAAKQREAEKLAADIERMNEGRVTW